MTDRRRVWRERAKGLARVTALFGVLAAIALTWSVAHAKSESGREARRLGKELLPLGDLLAGHHRIALNGEEISLANNVTDQPVTTVLDRFAAHCRDHAGTMADISAEIARGNKLSHEAASNLVNNLSIVRDEEDGEGIVLCLTRNNDTKPLDAMRAFLATRDLGELGKLRYAYARPTGSGMTHVMTVWTDGAFRLDRLLTEAEGHVDEDLREVPRPPDSRLVFDARVRDTPYAVRVYRTQSAPLEVASFYDQHMDAKGWDVAAPPAPGGEARGYVREGVQIILGASRDEQTGATMVSLSEMGAVVPTSPPATIAP